MYYDIHTPVKRITALSRKAFQAKVAALWPALKGSLALVHKPCIRANCRICARGDKHPNYLLSFTQAGRRHCLYVPKAMVPALKRALENGRKIEQLLYALGPALLRQYRAQNPTQTGPAAQVARSSGKKSQPKS